MQRYIFSEECARAETVTILPFGINMVGPVIYTFGSPEQKERFLPKILSAEHWWCQGYSEPEAGSDLAQPAHHRRARWRRLRHQWAKNLDDAGAIRQLDFCAGAH